MRRPERFLSLLLAALAVVGCASGPAPRGGDRGDTARTAPIAQRAINNAQALLDRGDAEAALAEAKIAIRADQRSAQAHVMHGMALEALGRGIEAGEDYEQAVRLAPKGGQVLNAYGAWLCRSGRTDDALKAFSDATADELYRQPTQALANAGSCAAEAGRNDQAEMNFRAALALAPENVQALAGMARLEHRRGDLLKARAFMQRREAVAPLTAPELSLAIEIETAAGDARAATRYRNQLATLAAEVEAAASSSGTGSLRQ
ncbi:MAG: type IV pilus biogenesis/stability protein PilW [Silanimonas sp.]